jgi:DNA mismatch endonuclease (patch repair protein)
MAAYRKTGKSALTTTAARSALMAKVRQRGTTAELAVRRILRRLGIPYRSNVAKLPGRPDLFAFDQRVAIFVHGCFWHRHHGCKAASTPRTNVPFWSAKFEANVRRDKAKTRALRRRGLRVLVVWECQTRDVRKLKRLVAMLERRLETH